MIFPAESSHKTAAGLTSDLRGIPSSCWLLLGAIIISWLPYLLIVSHDLSFGDEGMTAQGAYRVFSGDIPYKDFFSALTPGSYYWYALFFKLFSPSFIVLRLGALSVSALLIVVIWLILSRISVRATLPYLLTGLFLAYFGGPVWFIASHHWLSALFCMISLYLLLPAQGDDSPPHLNILFAGILAAAAAFSLQHRGMLWIVAASCSLLCLPAGKRFKGCTAFWGGILLFACPWLLYFIRTAGWNTLYYDLVIFPLTQYGKLAGHSGIDIHPLEMLKRYVAAWQQMSKGGGIWQIIVWSFGLAGMYLIYFLPFLAVAGLFSLHHRSVINRIQSALLVGALAASYFSALHRLSDTTLFFAAPAALLIVALALNHGMTSADRTVQRMSHHALAGLSLLCAAIAVGYSIQAMIRPSTQFKTPAGTIKTIFPDERKTFAVLAPFTQKYIIPGNDVFCYPYNPIHFFLFRLNNPTPFDTLTYPMHTTQQLATVEAILEKNKTRWVIVDSYQKNELSADIPFESYLMKQYRIRQSSPYATILERQQ